MKNTNAEYEKKQDCSKQKNVCLVSLCPIPKIIKNPLVISCKRLIAISMVGHN